MVLTNSAATLVVLDWAVLIHLILWFPVFFLLQVFHRAVYTVSETQLTAEQREDAARHIRLRSALDDRDSARARAYADVLRAFALHAAALQMRSDYAAAQVRLRAAIEVFYTHWDGAGVHASAVVVGFHPEVLDDVAEAPTRQDVEAFRDLYIAALARSGRSLADARAYEAEVAALAAEDLQIHRRTLKPRRAVRYMVNATAVKDKVAAALALLVWSVWMYATPSVWTRWRDYGRKPACDGSVSLYFVFKPFNPYNDGFWKFLIVFASGSIPVAMVATFAAVWLLTVGIFGANRASKYKPGRDPHRRGRATAAADEERAERRDTAPVTYSRQSHYARCRHADEILDTIHSRQTREVKHRYRRRHAKPLHFTLLSIPWAVLLAVLLIYSIAMVELMTSPARVDFVRPNLHETTEILVFLLGLLLLLMVLWSVVARFVQTILRRRHRGRVGHHGKAHHPHEHGQPKEKAAAKGHQAGSREALFSDEPAEVHRAPNP